MIVELPLHPKSGQYVKFWKIDSATNRSLSYVVSKNRDGSYACSCPAWTHHTPRRDCKHIDALVAQLLRGHVPTMDRREVVKNEKLVKALSRFGQIEI